MRTTESRQTVHAEALASPSRTRGASSFLSRGLMVRGIIAGLLLFASQDLWRVIFNVVYAPSALTETA